MDSAVEEDNPVKGVGSVGQVFAGVGNDPVCVIGKARRELVCFLDDAWIVVY